MGNISEKELTLERGPREGLEMVYCIRLCVTWLEIAKREEERVMI